MDLSRRVWSGLVTALPALAVSLRYFDVYFHPHDIANRELAEGADLLAWIEFFMLFVAAFTIWIAGRATVLNRLAAMSGLGIVFGAITWGLWFANDGSSVMYVVGLLIAARFLSAVIAGPEAVVELSERAVLGLLFYFGTMFVAVGLPKMMHNYDPHPAATFCAFYFLLLALVDAAHIYARTSVPASRRPSVRLDGSEVLTQSSLVLRFAGDAFEVASFERVRPAGRILTIAFGATFVGLGLAATIATRGQMFLISFIPLAMGGAIVVAGLRGRTGASSLQVRPGSLAKLNFSNGKLDGVAEAAAADVSFDIERVGEHGSVWFCVNLRDEDGWWMMPINSGLKSEGRWLQRLIEIYMKGDPSPQGLHKALNEEPGVVALLGPEVIKRLLAAPQMEVREGTLTCPGCKNEIAASAVRCGYCGMLYPALEN